MFLAFIAKEWKWVAGLLILVVALFGFYEELKLHRPLPMAVIKGVTKLEVGNALTKLNLDATQAPAVAAKMIQAEREAPQVVYITANQSQADKQANVVAKKDEADGIIKQTIQNSATGSITNEYFGIHMAKNNRIFVGGTAIDRDGYFDIGYTHKKDTVILHTKPFSGDPILRKVKGVSYERTVLEW